MSKISKNTASMALSTLKAPSALSRSDASIDSINTDSEIVEIEKVLQFILFSKINCFSYNLQ